MGMGMGMGLSQISQIIFSGASNGNLEAFSEPLSRVLGADALHAPGPKKKKKNTLRAWGFQEARA